MSLPLEIEESLRRMAADRRKPYHVELHSSGRVLVTIGEASAWIPPSELLAAGFRGCVASYGRRWANWFTRQL